MRIVSVILLLLALSTPAAAAPTSELILDFEPLLCNTTYEHGWFPPRPVTLLAARVSFALGQYEPGGVGVSLYRMPGYRHLAYAFDRNLLERILPLYGIPLEPGEWLYIAFWCYDDPGPSGSSPQPATGSLVLTLYYE